MSGRAKRVLVYTASLLLAPLPAMPYARGTREFAIAVMAWGAVMTFSSLYVARGEGRLKARGLLGNKLLAAAVITLAFGVLVVVGSAVYLGRGCCS